MVAVFRQVAAYLVLPNLPFWAGGHFFFVIPRSLFNVDYLVVGLLSLFLSRTMKIAVFAVVFLLDVLGSTISFFYFSQHDLVSSIRYLIDLRWQHTVWIGASLLVIGITLALLTERTAGIPARKNRLWVAATFALLLAVLSASRYRDAYEGPWLASSPTHQMFSAVWAAAFSGEEIAGLVPVASAAERFLRPATGVGPHPRRHNLVLVLVESYGEMNDVRGAAKLESPFRASALLEKYDVETGTIEFHGPTVAGEFRDLCGVRAGIGSSRHASEISGRCLPKLLEKEGYETTAVHGFLGAMFDRETWYRKLGFQSVQFLEDLRKVPGTRTCGGICPGICDTDVARLLERKLVGNEPGKPQFIYWLTLNSHLPVPITQENNELMACGSPNANSTDLDICNWMALIYRVNVAVADLSMTPGLQPTEFIIVGDHAPPFLSRGRRQQFSQAVVPFVHLVPKPQASENRPAMEQTTTSIQPLYRSLQRGNP